MSIGTQPLIRHKEKSCKALTDKQKEDYLRIRKQHANDRAQKKATSSAEDVDNEQIVFPAAISPDNEQIDLNASITPNTSGTIASDLVEIVAETAKIEENVVPIDENTEVLPVKITKTLAMALVEFTQIGLLYGPISPSVLMDKEISTTSEEM